MDNSVIIKGLNNGIIVVLDSEIEFDLLKEKVSKKFRDSSKFLGNAQVALSFEGRKLTEEQQLELLQIISEQSELKIVCLVLDDPEKEDFFRKSITQNMDDKTNSNGQFYKGNLRSGQSIESDKSVVLIGDVNPGASITSSGNIVVLGALRGTVFAGASGNDKAFVLALDMSPVQIRIADTIARAPDNHEKSSNKDVKIAFLEDGNIYIESVTKKILSEREL